MSKLGIGCCGGHSAHNHNSSTKSSGSTEKNKFLVMTLKNNIEELGLVKL